jgi:hypothetical protein
LSLFCSYTPHRFHVGKKVLYQSLYRHEDISGFLAFHVPVIALARLVVVADDPTAGIAVVEPVLVDRCAVFILLLFANEAGLLSI